MRNKPKILHFHVFGYRAYIFLPVEICVNKLALHSEFIGYKNNRYHFIHYIQENTIFYSTHAIFDKGLFPKCTNSHAKECKLYDELFDKISLEIESLVSNSSEKNRPTLVPILHKPISPIQNNPPTHSSLPSLSYKSISPPLTPGSKKPIVEIEETNDIDSDVEMQLPSSQ